MNAMAARLLRWLGLLFELACIAALVGGLPAGSTLGRVATRPVLIAGAAVGFLVWAVGLGLQLRLARRSRSSS
jgi:hypothetical protein